MVLIEPAKNPTASTRSASRTDIVLGTVDWPPCPTRSHHSTARSTCSCTRPSAWRCTCATCCPSMMGIFVSRGKREVKSHLPGYEAPAPPTPPVPMPDVADIRRKMGDSIGLARGVAGGGIGLARDMTGTALQGLMAFRNLAAQAAAEDQASTRPPPGSPTRVHRRRPRSPTPGSAPVADHAAARGCARRREARAGGRRPSDTRLRRAVGLTGHRTTRRPRRRVHSKRSARTRRATADATRSSARSLSSPDVEASRPAGEHDIARIVELAHVIARRAVGDEGRRDLAATRSVARTARRRVPRPARTRRRAAGRRDDRRRRAGLRRRAHRTAPIRRPLGRGHRPVRGGRGARGGHRRSDHGRPRRVLHRTRVHRHRRARPARSPGDEELLRRAPLHRAHAHDAPPAHR